MPRSHPQVFALHRPTRDARRVFEALGPGKVASIGTRICRKPFIPDQRGRTRSSARDIMVAHHLALK